MWIADGLGWNAGTERQMIEIGSRLDRNRFDLSLVTFEEQPAPIRETFRLTVFPMPHLWRPGGVVQVMRLRSFLRSNGFVLLHSFMVKSGIAGTVAGKLAGTPVILTSRRDLGYYYTPRFLRMIRVLNKMVTRVTANSEAAKRVAVEHEHLDPRHVDVLYNGVDFGKFRPSAEAPASVESRLPEFPPGSKVVGIVANYRPVKDLGLFVRACAVVAAQVPEARFLLAGSGSLQGELESLASQLGIRDRVVFTGGRGDVAGWLQQMCIGCLSSLSEGFSNAILEYMAASLPVVAVDAGGISEAVQDGVTGFVVKDRSPEAFAAPLIRLLQNDELRRQLGRNGLEVCRSRFSLDVAVRTLEEYYDSLLAARVQA